MINSYIVFPKLFWNNVIKYIKYLHIFAQERKKKKKVVCILARLHESTKIKIIKQKSWKCKTQNPSPSPNLIPKSRCGAFAFSLTSMADSVISIQYLKDFVNSQIYDDEKWAFNAVISLSPSSYSSIRFATAPFVPFSFDSGLC